MKRHALFAPALAAAWLSTQCKTTTQGDGAVKDATPTAQAGAVPASGAPFTCALKKEVASPGGGGKRFDCEVQAIDSTVTKTFHVLELRGTFVETAEQHGYLMADVTDEGPMPQIVRTIEDGVSGGAEAPIKRKLVECVVGHMEKSVSEEFVQAIDAFFKGYLKRNAEDGRQGFLKEGDRWRLMAASLAIELDNVVDGIKHRAGLGGADRQAVVAEIASACGGALGAGALEALKQYVTGMAPDGVDHKFGCTGFVAPGQTSAGGHLVHARNLDADLIASWNAAPTLYLVHETGKHPYVAGAAGGLVYAGGISGYNDAGVTTALHQMYPHRYRFKHPAHTAEIAPFKQQRILRDAASVDEAVAIMKSAGNFAPWTMQVSDAKTGDVVSFEFAAEKTDLARKSQGKPMSQTNHYLSPVTKDQAYTPYYNKHLESRSRMKVLDAALSEAQGTIDVDFAVNALASHTDAHEGFRSFGRVAVKPYGVMSTIALPTKGEFWVTLGERVPAAHSTWVGFKIDLDQLTATPLGTKRVQLYKAWPNWEKSLSTYVEAREAYIRDDLETALVKLDKAVAEAEEDEAAMPAKAHLPYYFTRARVRGEAGRHADAVKDWDFLSKPEIGEQLLDYQRALVAMYSVIAHQAAEAPLPAEERAQRLTFAQQIFAKYWQQDEHPDLQMKLGLVKQLQQGQMPAKLPHLDFVTIE